jgi:hypothetical protein
MRRYFVNDAPFFFLQSALAAGEIPPGIIAQIVSRIAQHMQSRMSLFSSSSQKRVQCVGQFIYAKEDT